jgi:ubiquinone/menaquinone biosynthesis C-methylase UbiE
VTAFARPKLRFIEEALGPRGRPLSMLELGAGDGFFSHTFSPSFDLVALDFSRRMLASNPLPPSRKLCSRAEALPFRDASFDVVFCGNLLHHLEDHVGVVREMSRVARAHVILLEPNATQPLMFLFGLLAAHERGTLRFTPRYLRSLGRRAGLSLRAFTVQGAVVPNRTPRLALPLVRALDGRHPLGFYGIAVFDKPNH